MTDGEFDERDPVWSTDGSTIYFVSTRVAEPYYEDADADLYSVPAAGGSLTTVASIDGGIGNLSLSPDGKRMAFVGALRGKRVGSYSQPDLWFRKAPWEDPQDFTARSPITHVANVTTPLMLVLGDEDYRTPPSDGGEMMFRALKYRKIPTVMVRFPRENHELSRSGEPRHRIERLEHIVGWMDQWPMEKKNPAYATP